MAVDVGHRSVEPAEARALSRLPPGEVGTTRELGITGEAPEPAARVERRCQRMATTRQKEAARQNLKRARQVQSARAHGEQVPRTGHGLSTAEQNQLAAADFAFPKQRKEPLVDAGHVRNAIARFDQVEGVSDEERGRAWKRIVAAAKKFDVEVAEDDWRDLFEGGKAKKH